MLPCKDCAYRAEIPGDVHINCMFDWEEADESIRNNIPSCSSQYAQKWFLFPFNYDPVWGPNKCLARSEEADPKMTKKEDYIDSLMSMLLKRM